MFDREMAGRAIKSSRKSWWGLAVAYPILLLGSYLTIWQFAEPMGIPDTIDLMPDWAKTRLFFHVVAAVVIGAHLTLILDLLARKSESSGQHEALSVKTELVANLQKALRRLVRSQGEFQVQEWTLTYRINEDGDDLLHEELTVSPIDESVYFYPKGYGVKINNCKHGPKLKSTSSNDGAPLPTLEVDRNNKKVRFAIVLDPPARVGEPRKIRIECKRSKLWRDLLEHDTDGGTLAVRRQVDLVRLEFVAPPGREWQTLRRATQEGTVNTEFKSGESRLVWELQNVSPKQYSYEVFLKPVVKN